MERLFDGTFYEKNNKKYFIVDKKVIEFLEPERGDIFLEAALFNIFKEEILEKYNLVFDEINFAIEHNENLYLVKLTPTYLEYFISKGDVKEAEDVVTEFIGYLIGYIKGFEIGFIKGLNGEI